MEGDILLCAYHQEPLSITDKNAHYLLEEGFWMSDKPLVQQALASELADILLKISDPSSSLLFLKGFWHTVVREWHGIDRLRYYNFISDAPYQLTLWVEWTNFTC